MSGTELVYWRAHHELEAEEIEDEKERLEAERKRLQAEADQKAQDLANKR